MTDRELMQAMSEQIGELVRHVAEIRQSNARLELHVRDLQTDMGTVKTRIDSMRTDIDSMRGDIDSMRNDIDSMRGDIRALNDKIDDKTEYISGKMDHFVDFYSRESGNIRARYEEVQYDRAADQRKTEQRFDGIEERLARLEAAASS